MRRPSRPWRAGSGAAWRRGGRLLPLAPLLITAACAPAYGPLPALCSDGGACPEGYDCIHGVCALPGTAVPITVAHVDHLRSADLRLIPQSNGVLVVWETYQYSGLRQRLRAARVTADGTVSPVMDLVTSFEADPSSVEPFFDVIARSDQELLIGIVATPLPSDKASELRLMVYRSALPPPGQEAANAVEIPVWSEPKRVQTIGYGTSESMKMFVREDHVELGCVRSFSGMVSGSPKIVSELAVYRLGLDGASLGAPTYYPMRSDATTAAGVVAAFATREAAWWVFDDVRPSALRVPSKGPTAEIDLPRLSMAMSATASSLWYLRPSARTGAQLPTDPVIGDAAVQRLDASQGSPSASFQDIKVTGLPTVRDAPRPAWIPRDGKTGLLLTPGAELESPTLTVYSVDPFLGNLTELAPIERFSTSKIGATAAVLVGGQLFVAWLDAEQGGETIRMAVVPEP